MKEKRNWSKILICITKGRVFLRDEDGKLEKMKWVLQRGYDTRWSLVAEFYGILNEQLCSAEDWKLKCR